MARWRCGLTHCLLWKLWLWCSWFKTLWWQMSFLSCSLGPLLLKLFFFRNYAIFSVDDVACQITKTKQIRFFYFSLVFNPQEIWEFCRKLSILIIYYKNGTKLYFMINENVCRQFPYYSYKTHWYHTDEFPRKMSETLKLNIIALWQQTVK